MTTPNLLTQLQHADMLLIDGLHAWQFELIEAASDEQVQLRVECMDGRERRVWNFSAAAIAAASQGAAVDCWQLAGAEASHELIILSGVNASNEDDDEAANDEAVS
ncbi:DUF5629 family protein [Aquipseudomonas campi]|uniref:DUF5629 family protein n=1 Tax=Aquipseudomonas campi TaxID=2731681 RepID=A0A6M8F2M1_9GAMM|nr:DUF5629 family protein [Pseudomonas campi]QKE62684.1 DUF5629 family protein [Pseudomonas campi]